MTSIAIVDDLKSSRQILRKIIESVDSRIVIHDFDRVGSAINWIVDHTPDLVVTDYKLPGADGLQFIEWLRSRPKSRQIPILMISMSNDMFLPMRARDAGATAFLRRPVDHQLVRARITRLLPRRNCLRLVVDNAQSAISA
jgi:two-component system, response regulator RpfG